MTESGNNSISVRPPVVRIGDKIIISSTEAGEVYIYPLGAAGTDRAVKLKTIGKDDWRNGVYTLDNVALPPGTYIASDQNGNDAIFAVEGSRATSDVYLHRTEGNSTPDQALWHAIRKHTEETGFSAYSDFVSKVFSRSDDQPYSFGNTGSPSHDSEGNRVSGLMLANHLHGPQGYSLLKMVTEAFLVGKVGLFRPSLFRATAEDMARFSSGQMRQRRLLEEFKEALGPLIGSRLNYNGLPYLQRISETLSSGIEDWEQSTTVDLIKYRVENPSMLELIWTYWHEESMLAQTTAVLALRFQNASHESTNRLREFELDPLRPLSNLFWGFIQDESNFGDKVFRRAHEYAHQYGLRLIGRAVEGVEPVDDRPKFLEAFHNLVHKASQFYREDSDTTVVADAFPLLSALREVHMVLAEGAHNQFGDMAWTSRVDMLTQQWLLARPEMREFLRGRYMVPYQERWMGAVDSMRKLQGWGDVSITHFNQLAVDGERILLSVRYGDWSNREFFEDQARNWVKYWKPEIQRYIHSYQAVTGVDLSVEITDVHEASRRYAQPSVLLQERLMMQRAPSRRMRVGAGSRPRAALPGMTRLSSRETLVAPRVPVQALRFESGE